MSEPATSARLRVESIDWAEVLPFVRLFGSFRQAIQPQKLGVSLLLVVLLFLGGKLLDAIWGGQVVPNEIRRYVERDPQSYRSFMANLHESRAEAIARGRTPTPEKLDGIFATALTFKLDTFQRLVYSAISLQFGFVELRDVPPGRDTVLGALRDLFVTLPGWMITTHPWFLVTYMLFALLLCSLLGGAIARMSAVQATSSAEPDATAAINFARQRWLWYFGAPLLPGLLIATIGLLLAVSGAIAFNVPVLDLAGALLFGTLLLLGMLMALLLIGLVTGGHLLYPAIAVDGADAFDAVGRAFNYVLGRPWQWLFYTLVALVYGAITYLFFGLIVFLTLGLTHCCLGLWVGRSFVEGAAGIDAVFRVPEFGAFTYTVQWQELGALGKATAALILVWVHLLIGLLPAYAISYYSTAHTWIYLLLRRSADGAELDELYEEGVAEQDADAEAGAGAGSGAAASAGAATVAGGGASAESPAPPPTTPPAEDADR